MMGRDWPFLLLCTSGARSGFGGRLLLQPLDALAHVGLHLVQALLKLVVLGLELLDLRRKSREGALQLVQAHLHAALCHGYAGRGGDGQRSEEDEGLQASSFPRVTTVWRLRAGIIPEGRSVGLSALTFSLFPTR